MKRVLIVNSCGLLSAMPTVEEFERLAFPTENCVYGVVEVSEDDAATIYANRTKVKVLLPSLPAPNEPGVYIAVLNGRVEILGERKLNQLTPVMSKDGWTTRFFKAFK